MAKKRTKKEAAEMLAKALKERIEVPEPLEPGEVAEPGTTRARFAANLKAIRKHSTLSQERLAEEAGVSGVAITLLESGKRGPSLEMIDKLSGVLKVEPDAFFREIK
jgi:DNA-binding XRE family transcriptional regulator